MLTAAQIPAATMIVMPMNAETDGTIPMMTIWKITEKTTWKVTSSVTVLDQMPTDLAVT